MKKLLFHFAKAFIIILGTSIMVAESMNIDIDPIILAGTFLLYFKAAKELENMIAEGHKYNQEKIKQRGGL